MKVHTWRIYPEKKSSGYYKVLVFPDHRSMWFFYKEWCKNVGWPLCHRSSALCQSYQAKNKKNLGFVLLHKKYLGSGIVSHELTHAAVHYLKYHKGKNLSWKNEERLCQVQGDLVRQFWVKYWWYVERGRR